MSFADLNLSSALLRAVEEDLQLERPTAIQAKAFSPIMAGRDVVGIAQTGTGKTFAYLLPLLRLWKFTKSPLPQILIIVPTRELVLQVVASVEAVTPYMSVATVGVYGGVNLKVHKAEIERGVDVVVGTPGRLVDLLKDNVLKLKQIKRFVLDEVDEMLDLGFRSQLNDILDFLPKKRQHLFFSATMIPEVLATIEQFTDYYELIETAPSGAPLENIGQYVYEARNFNTKANLLEHLLATDGGMEKVLVFCATRRLADALYERLNPDMNDAVAIIHSSKTQNYRIRSIEGFAAGNNRVLIATDLVARGIDVEGVTHVINFDVATTAEQHTHRIGRTGRAKAKGTAYTFVSQEEADYLAEIEALMGISLPILPLPPTVIVTDELIDLEKDPAYVPEAVTYLRPEEGKEAYHTKSAKNQKVNVREGRRDKMMKKYKKPQTRGSKK